MAQSIGTATIVITGVAQGLGRALTEEFIAQGHRVIGCDLDGAAIAGQQHGSAHRLAVWMSRMRPRLNAG